jgi:hypothetical protein
MPTPTPSPELQEILTFRDEAQDMAARSRPGEPFYEWLTTLAEGVRHMFAQCVDDPAGQVSRATMEAWKECNGAKFGPRLRQLFEHAEKAILLEYPGLALARESDAFLKDWEEFMQAILKAGVRITAEDN